MLSMAFSCFFLNVIKGVTDEPTTRPADLLTIGRIDPLIEMPGHTKRVFILSESILAALKEDLLAGRPVG